MGRIKYLQGTPAFIETHYEALHYYRQEKKICHFRSMVGGCNNDKCLHYNKECAGYTECPEFITTTRYLERDVKKHKPTHRLHKNDSKKQEQKVVKNKQIKPKKKKKKPISKNKSNKILKEYERSNKNCQSDSVLGNDPRLKEIFDQFKE